MAWHGTDLIHRKEAGDEAKETYAERPDVGELVVAGAATAAGPAAACDHLRRHPEGRADDGQGSAASAPPVKRREAPRVEVGRDGALQRAFVRRVGRSSLPQRSAESQAARATYQ